MFSFSFLFVFYFDISLIQASGWEAFASGRENTASGAQSVALGHLAQAIHDGSYVFSDGSASFASTAARQFRVLASGGVELLTSLNPLQGASLATGTNGMALKVEDNGFSVSYGSSIINASLSSGFRLSSEAVVFGVPDSGVGDGGRFAVVFGGGPSLDANRAMDDYSSVVGGRSNTAGSSDGNSSSSVYAGVFGGAENAAKALSSVVTGGERNTVHESASFG